MKRHGEPKRRRCSECRSWFVPARTAAQSQRVCGEECRRHRRGRQARGRRRADLQEYRVEERERQRAHRERRRSQPEGGAKPAEERRASPSGEQTPGSAGVPSPREPAGHAPPSLGNLSKKLEKLLKSWDKAQALSRASLLAEIQQILRGTRVVAGTSREAEDPQSRATLGP